MKIFGIIFIIIMIVSMAIFFTVHDSNKIGKLHNKYNDVTINDEFIGEIMDLYTTKGASFVVLGDSMKFFLTNSRNYKYSGENRYLSHILSKGDTIVKKKGTDTLIVKKQNKEYYYVLGKFINKTK